MGNCSDWNPFAGKMGFPAFPNTLAGGACTFGFNAGGAVFTDCAICLNPQSQNPGPRNRVPQTPSSKYVYSAADQHGKPPTES